MRNARTLASAIGVLLLMTVLLPRPATADPAPVRYTFTYQPLEARLYAGFSFSFMVPDFITTTGPFQLPSPVRIGADVITHAGTNRSGDWIFGNGIGELISETQTNLEYDTLTFAFTHPSRPGYITGPGTYSGYQVQGLTSAAVRPQLNVFGPGEIQASVVPEPGTLVLLGGAAAVAALRRSRKRPG